ncbi:HNH endonuclease [Knoellia sp. 3-2P3]|uniref:HNH endonuclease n=1 Tax=unclassified Knoellia TaxID=2618719 RepID=UPI0023DAAB9A|nr:HNH endonuclease [Knoellia sp. 3-2P3]MDF2090725.1 HNH endonuclease [Knoellia sp. 3-2P3]
MERPTGQVRPDDVGIEVGLVMTDAALLTGASTPAHLHTPGLPGAVVPAAFARDLLRSDTEEGCTLRAKTWLRRLYSPPCDGTLVAMDSHRRLFDGQLRRFLVHRDQSCRTPWCGAPIRHADHVRPSASGGDTSAENGQGLCAACNLTKEGPGWRSAAAGPPPEERHPHTVRVTTPTDHAYSDSAPPVLETFARAPSGPPASLLEAEYQHLLDLAA